ncbi:hypothetical protein [Pseudomonas sp. HS6]|uniref:hypothetical protein n=1 Tax=Pseudomonas sp. HS6 TaxID=2850559 RepID=UPI00201921D7|nr:hypothetical protein [Pseudomonas sp. HS6]UQS16598.1 caspase family protein [Pseudomonas sp. HS6]
MGRRACLAIGVSTVTAATNEGLSFAYLDGAIFAARSMGEWALRSGFGADNVRVVDDGDTKGVVNPVTKERVQKAVDELFPAGAEVVDQLILSFCGHGLTDENLDSINWLFSDSLLMRYRVVANRFYSELLLHGIKRITLITDACRGAPNNLDLMRFEGVRGITVQGTKVESPRFDRLASCQDGQLGYMVYDQTANMPGKCVFSGVIVDALWGSEPSAFENGVITTATLGNCVRSRTTERANEYHVKLYPQCLVDPESVVLYDTMTPPQGPIDLQPWPVGSNTAVLGVESAVGVPDSADHILERIHIDRAFRDRILGQNFGLRRFNLTAPDSHVIPIPADSKDLLKDLVDLRQTTARIPGQQQKVKTLVQQLESQAAAREVRNRLEQIEQVNNANLIVWGDRVKIHPRSRIHQLAFNFHFNEFHLDSDSNGTPVLVELSDGQFTPVVPYTGLYAVVTPSPGGNVFQAYGEMGSPERYRVALQAIDDFAAGRLQIDSLDRLAADLRHEKHADPMLGVICAYLYRATADYDNIRRMAYFYGSQGQPVPYDIALLGAMQVTRNEDGNLRLHVPAVKAREMRQNAPSLPGYATQATPDMQARIGGRCPWLGLGWDYVNDPRPEWAVLVEGLADHAANVRRSGATTLPEYSARRLARLWGLLSG